MLARSVSGVDISVLIDHQGKDQIGRHAVHAHKTGSECSKSRVVVHDKTLLTTLLKVASVKGFFTASVKPYC